MPTRRLVIEPGTAWLTALLHATYIARTLNPGARNQDCSLLVGPGSTLGYSVADAERYGTPILMCGVRLRFNEAQPFGTADLICGDTIVSMEPIL